MFINSITWCILCGLDFCLDRMVVMEGGVTGMNVKSVSEPQTSNLPFFHVQVVIFHMLISDMNIYNEMVQEDLGPHWTNSGY